MKLNIFYIFLIYLVFFSSSFSQGNLKNSLTDDVIKNKIILSKELIKKGDMKSYQEGFFLLDSLEITVENNEEVSLILTFYLEKATLLFENYDYDNSLKYIDKSIKILKNYNDKRILGLNYELIGVIKNTQEKFEERDAAFLKSASLLSKHGNPEENIDINFNLAYVYKEYKNWEKTIYYSKQSIHFIELSNKNLQRKRFLALFIAEGYLSLNNLEKTKEYLEIVENDDYFLQDHSLLMASYYKIKGGYFEKMNDFKKATEAFNISSDFYQKLSLSSAKGIKETLKLKHDLQLKGIENNRIIKEIELHEENHNYKNFILFLSVIITSVLIFLVFFQYNTSRFKSKVNKILEHNNADLIEKNAEIKQALSVKNKFLDTITHELRTPLNTIKGITYLLKESDLKENEKEYVYNLEFSSNYLLGLINNIIDYDLIEGVSPNQLIINEFNLKRLVLNIISTFKLGRTNNNTFECEIDEFMPKKLSFDALKLAQILINLIENSNKYTFNGNVKLFVSIIKIEANNCVIEFKLEDSGIKMPQQIQDYFNLDSEEVRIESDNDKQELGIAIIKRNIRLYDSNLVFDNDKLIGNKLSFVLNFTKSENIEDDASILNISQNNVMSILLVEDNKVNQIITKKILSKLGFTCDVADDGLIALNKVKENDYSLILMDIMMPIMDGFESSKEITKIKPYIPIIALTAISKDVNKDKFIEANIREVLTKPVDVELMTKTIYKYI